MNIRAKLNRHQRNLKRRQRARAVLFPARVGSSDLSSLNDGDDIKLKPSIVKAAPFSSMSIIGLPTDFDCSNIGSSIRYDLGKFLVYARKHWMEWTIGVDEQRQLALAAVCRDPTVIAIDFLTGLERLLPQMEEVCVSHTSALSIHSLFKVKSLFAAGKIVDLAAFADALRESGVSVTVVCLS